MTDQELRAMIRESIARHMSGDAEATVRLPPSPPGGFGVTGKADTTYGSHPSFVRLSLASGDSDGACLIEPSVRCNHCGYCLSYGH